MRKFLAGLIAGVIIMVSVPVIAQNINAVIDDSLILMIDGEVQTLPESYHILRYGIRTYLPIRYVAESLGATVAWNDSMGLISITSPEPRTVEVERIVEKEVEKIVYVDREVEPTSASYRETPVSDTKDRVYLRVNHAEQNGTNTWISMEVENRRSERIYLDYFNAELIVGGRTVKTNANGNDTFMYSDIEPNDHMSGFFSFPRVDNNASEFTLKIPVKVQGVTSYPDTTQPTINFEFKFKADLRER